MALPIGSHIEVSEEMQILHEEGTYELPVGLRGIVTYVDEKGDALIKWSPEAGQQAPISRWLLENSFSNVKVMNPMPIPPDFIVQVEKQDDYELDHDSDLGLVVDMPGGVYLRVRDVSAVGLIPGHNAKSPIDEHVDVGDVIVDVNGVFESSDAMLEELMFAKKLALGIRRTRKKDATLGLPPSKVGGARCGDFGVSPFPRPPSGLDGKSSRDTLKVGRVLTTEEVLISLLEPDPKDDVSYTTACARVCRCY